MAGMGLEEARLVEADTVLMLANPLDRDRALDREGGNIERAENFLEARAILHVVEQLRQLHQPHSGQLFDHERVEIIAPHLAVGHDIDAGILLVLDRGEDRVVRDAVEFLGGNFFGLAAAQRVHQPFRPRP